MKSSWVLEKQFKFEASHQLPYHDGKCRNLHGHSWVGTLIVEGSALVERGPKQGMVIDYGDLSELLTPLVDTYLDHQHLNETLSLESPTSERIAQWLYHKLRPLLPVDLALWVRINETATSSCVYTEYTESRKKVWRTREGVCCHFGLTRLGSFVHEKGCPNQGKKNDCEPVDLRNKKARAL